MFTYPAGILVNYYLLVISINAIYGQCMRAYYYVVCVGLHQQLEPLSKELRDKALLKIATILTRSDDQVNTASAIIQTETNRQSEITTTKVVHPTGIEESSVVSSSLIFDFLKFLTSLYKTFLSGD